MYSVDKRFSEILVEKHKYIVPFFQRPIMWKREHIRQLQNDIESNILEANGSHFMGMIVVQQSGNTRTIWDGQQRLFSLVSLICAGRDILLSSGNKILGESLDRTFILRGPKPGWSDPVLELSDIDQRTFKEYVLPKFPKPTDYETESRTAYIYDLMTNWLVTLSTKNGSEPASLHSIVNKILSNLQFIVAVTKSDSDAFKMFETLNDRGRELSATDLIKNYIFSKLNKDLYETMLSEWNNMILSIGIDNITDYIRHFFVSRYGTTSKTTLFDDLKKVWEGLAISIHQLASDLISSSQAYLQLSRDYETSWKDDRLIGSLRVLRELDTTQWLPILLAMNDIGYDERELQKIADVLETMIIRGYIVGNRSYSSFYNQFSRMSVDLWKDMDRKDEILDAILEELQAMIPEDDEFKKNFENLSGLSMKKSRVLLGKMETHLRTKESLDALMVGDVDFVYPLSDESGWPSDNDADYVQTEERKKIGNIVLLAEKMSRAERKRSFSSKKELYMKHSCEFALNNIICEADSWNDEAIQSRQEYLSVIALDVWPHPRNDQ